MRDPGSIELLRSAWQRGLFELGGRVDSTTDNGQVARLQEERLFYTKHGPGRVKQQDRKVIPARSQMQGGKVPQELQAQVQ
jgi:hypothetical protein